MFYNFFGGGEEQAYYPLIVEKLGVPSNLIMQLWCHMRNLKIITLHSTAAKKDEKLNFGQLSENRSS